MPQEKCGPQTYAVLNLNLIKRNSRYTDFPDTRIVKMPEYSLSSKIVRQIQGELFQCPLYTMEQLENLHQVLPNSPSAIFATFNKLFSRLCISRGFYAVFTMIFQKLFSSGTNSNNCLTRGLAVHFEIYKNLNAISKRLWSHSYILCSAFIPSVHHIVNCRAKSLQRSPTVRDFYGTGIEIQAGFGPIGITEKKGLGLL